MFKLGSLGAALLATTMALEATPFKGEHANAKHILRDDGSTAVRVEPKYVGSHKHEKMVARNLNKKSSDPVTVYD